MKDWAAYKTADEFASDENFRRWVASGTYGQKEHLHTQFLNDHVDLVPLAQQAADLLRITSFPDESLTADQLNTQIEATWQKVRQLEDTRATSRFPFRQVWFRWAAAAMVVLVGGLGWWSTRKNADQSFASKNHSFQSQNWQAFTNTEKDVRPLSLSDGSVVWLAPGSTLRFPAAFKADKREVALTGEAFFEVYKNAKQPFFVETQDLITRVVGTSFLVKGLANHMGTIVQVRTGKVLVYRADDNTSSNKPIALVASQQLRVSENSEQLVTEPVKQPSILSARLDEQPFEFTDMPLSTVLSALSVAYGVQVEYDKDSFRNCQITTSLTDEPLTEKLNILAETIGPDTRAELVGDKIRITGGGCP